MKKLFLFLISLVMHKETVYSQSNFAGYGQLVDISAYKVKSFNYGFYTKSRNTVAFMACYDKENKFVRNFQSEGITAPIGKEVWEQLTLSGKMPKNVTKVFVGFLYQGNGEFQYDNFSLILKGDNVGDTSVLKNGNFEDAGIGLAPFRFMQKVPDSALLVPDTKDGGKNILKIVATHQGTIIPYGNNSPAGKYVDVNGVRLYYETYGTGSPLILLHGALESMASYAPVIPLLANHYQVIALDTRGHGKSSSDEKKPTYQLYADDVYKFMHALNLDSVNLLGWSDGGNTGLILAMSHPEKVKGLAIMGANLYNNNTVVEGWVNDTLRSRIKELEGQPASPQRDFELSVRKCLLTEPNIDPIDLHNIKCRTLVMAGEKDIIKPAHTKLIAKEIPHATLILFKSATHYAPVEIPEQFSKAVIDFFDAK